MAELTADPCCAPERQATCCEPAAKDDCCGHEEGCGCAFTTPKVPLSLQIVVTPDPLVLAPRS